MRRTLTLTLFLLLGGAASAQSALLEATYAGDADAVRVALAAGDDVDGEDGTPPLIAAAQEGHLEIVRLLLDAGADPYVVEEGYRGTPDQTVPFALVRHAFDRGDEAAAELAVDLVEQLGTAADEPDVLRTAVRWGRAPLVARLLALGADATARVTGGGFDGPFSYTLLHTAVSPPLSLDTLGRRYAPTEVVRLLLDAGADPNAYAENYSREPGGASRFGSTPLHDAAWEGRFAELAELLTHGADASLPTVPGEASSVTSMTALELARARLAGLDAELARFEGEVPFDYFFPTPDDLDAVITLLE